MARGWHSSESSSSSSSVWRDLDLFRLQLAGGMHVSSMDFILQLAGGMHVSSMDFILQLVACMSVPWILYCSWWHACQFHGFYTAAGGMHVSSMDFIL